MTDGQWKKSNNNPELPPDMKKVVSHLKAIQIFLEKKLKEDQLSIDRLNMELEKVKAQAEQAQKENEDG